MIPKQSAGVRPASDEKGLVPSCWAPVAVQLRLGAVGRTEEPAYAVGKGGREDERTQTCGVARGACKCLHGQPHALGLARLSLDRDVTMQDVCAAVPSLDVWRFVYFRLVAVGAVSDASRVSSVFRFKPSVGG